MDTIHKKVEEYIAANMDILGVLYSLNRDDPRDYSTAGAPLLKDGSEKFVVFHVSIKSAGPAAISYAAKRYIGTVQFECHMLKESTPREYFALAESISQFLVGKGVDGVYYKGVVNGDDYSLGKWRVYPAAIPFSTNIQQ